MEIFMDLNDELNNLSKRIREYINNNQVKSEQATINYLIKPFLRLLGFDDSNPAEVVPEFTADIGTKKDEKVDLAIFKEGKVIMLIECKDCNSELSQKDLSQLFRYFTVTDARIGILTNGIQYEFFTDSDKPNLMDTKPFFEFTTTEILPSVAHVLNYLTKDNFDLNKILFTAIDLKHRIEIKEILRKQLDTPTNDIVEFFHSAIQSQVEKQDFTDIVKRAFNEFLDEEKSIQEHGINGKEQPKKDVGDEQLSNGKEQSKKDVGDEQLSNGKEQPKKDVGDEQLSNGTDEKTGRKEKKVLKFTNIKVTMPDGSVIYHHNGKKTYLEVLEKFGLEKVMRVRPEIVSREQFPYATKGVERGEFFVRVMIGNGTKGRVEELKTIAKLLKKDLKVEQVVKNSKSD